MEASTSFIDLGFQRRQIQYFLPYELIQKAVTSLFRPVIPKHSSLLHRMRVVVVIHVGMHFRVAPDLSGR